MLPIKKTILIPLTILFCNYLYGQFTIKSVNTDGPVTSSVMLSEKDWFHNTLNKKVTYDKTVKDVLIINRGDGLLTCYDSKFKKQWTFKHFDTIRLNNGSNHFFYKDGTIFSAYMTGNIYAINAKNGVPFWASKVGARDGAANHFTSQSLAITEGKLFLTSRTSRNLYAINSSNGSLVWNYKLVSPHSYRPYLAINDKIFINNDPLINSFETESGTPLIQKNFESNLGKAVTNGKLIIVPVTRGDKIVSFLPDTFEEKWEFTFKAPYYNVGEKIFVDNNNVYFATETDSDHSGVYCLNANDGSLIWEKTIKGDVEKFEKHNDIIYGYTSDKIIFSITLKNGDLKKIQTNYQPVSNIQIHHKFLYYYAKEGLIRHELESKEEEIIIPHSGKERGARDTQILFVK
ncbi:outer membrane protein assembly factor BamB family protein [Tenacibaculum jejuense]|uniref:Pyrrolo-quinoline quinone repeat-containing protein n=1 Tax=Tenacibaculum jejuense TaxID=584609 RepID=A0A238UEP0_9FLAO|nr:PQQ-binding-like beta-propeller repeat protein [Tenacibaculum jejuense]SNR16944.1 Pyrrolo-quinoline quinone repeat-containing protein [Tenacibaculum jejuense]